MDELENIQVELVLDSTELQLEENDLERIIFDLNSKIEMLSSKVDKWDCLIALGSGLLCGMMDIFWTGEFSLAEGRELSSQKVDELVKKIANMMGCESDDLKKCVKFLEEKFPIPADGNTPDFGGGLQHHLRDFAHHPTIVGLFFSLLTQFTSKSYGTDSYGRFMIVDVPEKSKIFIGEDIPSKIMNGTVVWFFHLISDIAGSNSTVGLGGGTGIPGPILSLLKEMSVLPFFNDLKKDDLTLSEFLSKLFNGTLFAKRDEKGKIISDTVVKIDLRGELGVAIEVAKQAIPVIANECIVRTFYMIRQLAQQIKEVPVRKIKDFRKIDVNKILPANSPTLTRMLTISKGVFTTLDVSEAIVTKKYWVSINYVGIGQFAFALGDEMVWALKRRNIRLIKEMYERIYQNTCTAVDQNIYERMYNDMEYDKFGINEEQIVILYNLEYYKTLHDIESTKILFGNEKIRQLKIEWLKEWKAYMTNGFPSFMKNAKAKLVWYSLEELHERISMNDVSKPWFRLALLEAMLFTPYFPLSVETNKKGNKIPSEKYSALSMPIAGYNKINSDKYLDDVFAKVYQLDGYVKRLRKCYDKVCRELNEVLKTALTSFAITTSIAVITIATVGAFAPTIAVALVGSNFAGLSGVALTNASLAYFGGGAVAAGGLGMTGGTIAIVGGGAILGGSIGVGVGGTEGAISLMGKKYVILQSAKLIVSVREVFLNDEKDVKYSNTVYKKYVQNICDIEKGLVELRLKAKVADSKEKKKLTAEIKSIQESLKVMKIAMRSLKKFISSYEVGLGTSE